MIFLIIELIRIVSPLTNERANEQLSHYVQTEDWKLETNSFQALIGIFLLDIYNTSTRSVLYYYLLLCIKKNIINTRMIKK
jgi:hypothetical protein